MGIIGQIDECGESDLKLGHYRVYLPFQLNEHIEAAGLEIKYQDHFYMKPLPTSMMEKLPVEILQGFDELGRKFTDLSFYIYVEAGFPD